MLFADMTGCSSELLFVDGFTMKQALKCFSAPHRYETLYTWLPS